MTWFLFLYNYYDQLWSCLIIVFGWFLVNEHASRKLSAAALSSIVVKNGDGAGRMNASVESTGMGFYKEPAAVGGARQLDATNQFANPRFL